MKINRILFAALPLVLSAQIEQAELEWVQMLGSEGILSHDELSASAVDPAGYIYVTGHGFGPLDTRDIFTIKMDNNGEIIWRSYFNGPGGTSDESEALALDAQGNVYILGHLRISSSKMGIIKYDSDGNELWYNTYFEEDGSHYHGVGLAVDASGNAYICGTYDDDQTVMVKYTADGMETWIQHFPIRIRALKVGPDGNVIMTGSDAAHHCLTQKVGSGGDLIWSASSESLDYGIKLQVNASGEVFVGASSQYLSEVNDFHTIKYDAAGNLLWDAIYDGAASASDILVDLEIDTFGSVYVTGKSHELASNYDITTLKYDSTGAAVWTQHYDGGVNDEDKPFDMVLDDSGNVFVTGYSTNSGGYTALKYGPSGTLEWSQQLDGHPGMTERSFVDVDPSNHLILIRSICPPDETDNILISSLESSGSEMWTSVYDGPSSSYDTGWDMTTDRSGNILVASSSRMLGQIAGFKTYKFEPDGNLVWSSSFIPPVNSYSAHREFIEIDPAGDIYTTGDINGDAGGFSLVKTDENGNEIWNVVEQTDGIYYRMSGMRVDSMRGVLISGIMDQTGFIRRYDSNGTLVWEQTPGSGEPKCLILDDSGYVYMSSALEVPEWPYNHDIVTAKYSPEGNELWTMTYNGSGDTDDSPGGLVLDSSGQIYVTGSSGSDYVTIKYQPDGSEIWVAIYDGAGAGYDKANAIICDLNNDIIVAGQSYGETQNYDFTTVKYDADGNELWVRRFDGPSGYDDHASQLTSDSLGNIYVSGECAQSEGSLIYAVKYSTDGDEIWVSPPVGVENYLNYQSDLIVTESGAVYILGNVDYYNYDVMPNWGLHTEMILAKFSQGMTTALPSLSNTPDKIKLYPNYPNPFNPSTSIQYSLSEAGSVRLTIYDIRGQEVMTLQDEAKPPGHYQVLWKGMDGSGNQVSAGVYFARLQVGDTATTTIGGVPGGAGSYSHTIKMLMIK